MKLFNLMLAAMLSGAVFTSAFAAEEKTEQPAAKKTAKKAAKKAKRPRKPLTYEQQLARYAKPAGAVPARHVKRIAEKKAYAEKNGKDIKIIMLGDSITHQWEYPNNKKFNDTYMAPYKVLNLGCGSDSTRNTLHIVEKTGILELTKPALVTIMIGTNNTFGKADPRVTAAAIKRIIEGVSARCPDAVILLHAIFPRGRDNNDPLRIVNNKVNDEIVKFCDGKKVIWFDIRKDFLTPAGVLERTMMPDLLHPRNKQGYHVWGKALKPWFDKYGK